MKKVITFGEIMMRLTASDGLRFTQATGFDAVYGGSEANAAVALCIYGTPASHVTRLPDNALGQAAFNSLRAHGVATDYIVRGGERLGVYYLESGAACRKQQIIYDRAGSAFACSSSDDYDWDKIFKDAAWFHFSGITPALSDGCEQACLNACKSAKKAGITVSCDLNYREKLWSSEKAGRVMSKLCEYTDICLAYEDEPRDIFGINITDACDKADGYRKTATGLADRFGFKEVAITNSRAESATVIDWAAMLYDGKDFYESRRYELDTADRVGGGDAFSGGFIHARMSGFDSQKTLDFAVASGSMKYSVRGDFVEATEDEVLNLINR